MRKAASSNSQLSSPLPQQGDTIVFINSSAGPEYAVIGASTHYRFLQIRNKPPSPDKELSAEQELALYEIIAFLETQPTNVPKKTALYRLELMLGRRTQSRTFNAAFGHVFGRRRGRPSNVA
ncbi:MAG: hypothetical protein J0I29_04470 [Rhizobiales bacterium]|nr:hypothetical protein [Hyphomicrobiales bacterium]